MRIEPCARRPRTVPAGPAGHVLWIVLIAIGLVPASARADLDGTLTGVIPSGSPTTGSPGVIGLSLADDAAKARGPIVLIDNEYDFATGPRGWTSRTFAYFSVDTPVTTLNSWNYVPAKGVWNVVPKSVINDNYWIGNYLTSPVIEVAAAVDVLQFNLIHRYNFPTNLSTDEPITAGQVTYRIFNARNPDAPFQPFLPGAFETGTVPPPFDARTPFATWDVPTFTAPTGMPPLIAAGLTWTNDSPGFAEGDFVASRATLRDLFPGDRVEFRLIHANLGRDCSGGAWDVSYVRVNGLFLPEPDGLLLASCGGIGMMVWFARRRRHHRASTPSVKPLTNTPPPVSVACRTGSSSQIRHCWSS